MRRAAAAVPSCGRRAELRPSCRAAAVAHTAAICHPVSAGTTRLSESDAAGQQPTWSRTSMWTPARYAALALAE